MRVIEGDLLAFAQQGEFDLIVHGCNCFCTMASGIAKQVKSMYPEAYEADKKTQKGDRSKLGSFSHVEVGDEDRFIIINAYTQYSYGRQKCHADYEALNRVFESIKLKYSGMRIGYPLIGSGLAGGDWNVISAIIEDRLLGENHSLVKFVN